MNLQLSASLASDHVSDHAPCGHGVNRAHPPERNSHNRHPRARHTDTPAVTAADVLGHARGLLLEHGWVPCRSNGIGMHVLEALYKGCITLGAASAETQIQVSDCLIAASSFPTAKNTVAEIEDAHMRSITDVSEWLERATERARMQ